MKATTSSENCSIRHEDELVGHFHELLREDPDLQWQTTSSQGQIHLLELKFDENRIEFQVFYALKPSLRWLEEIRVLSTQMPVPTPLIVTPELSSRLLKACKDLGLCAIDLNGRCWLRAPGLLVDRSSLPGRSFTYEYEPKNIFTGKSARIVRCLLTDRGRIWTQAEIVTRTQASSGLVSRIIQHLISRGFAEKRSAREFILRDWQGLLDDWASSDHFAKRTRTTHYAGFLATPQELAAALQRWATSAGIPLAFTQWIAAWVRHPFTEPPVCSAYVARLPDRAELEQLGLRQVTEAGKLWLHVPDDEGILRETRTCNELTLVTDAQIYLDLQRTGLRGPDAATALRESADFCLP